MSKNYNCDYCKVPIYVTFPKSQLHLKHRFCSRNCFTNFRKQKSMKKCSFCQKQFHRRGRITSKSGNIFCSDKCYRSHNIGENHPNWKNGKCMTDTGYIEINSPRILEHRHIMEKHLNKKLSKNEIVHHINGIKTDNRIENLKIVTREKHARLHASERSSNLTITCLHCGILTPVYPYLVNKKKFCSNRCKGLSKRKSNRR